jgi:23S rRNA pseudoU1915 N3-methylase RlmH
VGLLDNFNDKLKALEDILASDPANFRANQFIGELIYDTLNSTKEKAVMPSNAAELETKMVTAFNKAGAAKKDYELSYLYIGDHFINKAVKTDEARTAHEKAMKAATKPGTKASPADIAKKEMLSKQYGEALEGARAPYEKAVEILAARAAGFNNSLEIRDKEQYKKAVSYLGDIASFKKATSKGADLAKYTAEEKKWNDKYDVVSKMTVKKKG